MGTITPILDTLLPQVLGRAGDTARAGTRSAHGPLSALRPIRGEMPTDVPRRAPYPGRGPIEQAAGAAVGTRSSSPQADALARGPAPAVTTGQATTGASAQLHLSRGADALTRLLATFGRAKAVAANDAGPLTDGMGPPRASALAAALGQQVATSGLFYESHLAQWVRGRYPLARLAAEPQARLARSGAVRSGRSESGSGSTTAGASDTPGAPAAADPRLAAVVRQQAELLASGVFHWHGEAWPGVPMRWQIHEPPDPPDDTPTDGPPDHATSLSLELDGMGPFEARLHVSEGRVRIAVWAEADRGRSLMAADLRTLRDRLRQAGFVEPSVRVVTESEA